MATIALVKMALAVRSSCAGRRKSGTMRSSCTQATCRITSRSKHLDIETPTLDATTYPGLLGGRRILPRDIVGYHLKVEGGARLDRSLAFYMDADSFMDIVDYWNLRALGRPVLAVPKQFAELDAYKVLARTYIKRQFRVSRFNPQMTYGTSLIRSFGSEMSELDAFARSLDLLSVFEDGVPMHALSLQHSYPRIWDEWAIGKDGAAPDNLSCTSETVSFPDTDSSVSFSLVAPDFRTDSPMEGPRYANEIFPKFYGAREDLRAEVLPYDHGDRVLRVAGGPASMRDELRIGRTGLVYLVDRKSYVSWDMPLAQDILFAWLADKGYASKLSSCGLLAKEIHTQLRGWPSALTDERVLKLLEDMSKGDEDGRGLPLGEVRNRLKQIDESGRIYNALIERKAFQLGYKTQCPHCGRASWYNVSALGSELTCPLCYKQVDAIKAVDTDNSGRWFLRTAGGFSVKNHADGAYCVLLTLNFFERGMHYQTTPVFSFEPAKPGGLELEADFATLWQESAFGETQDGVLFAECKSYNKFERRDYDRMRALANAFPGAILAFCTLRPELDPAEVRAISRIVRSGMKHWKTDRPLNPVLVLTGRELFSLHDPPYCWDGLSIPDWAKHPRSLLEICNATQALYLGLPPWYEVWQARWDARRRKKQQATAMATSDGGIAPPRTGKPGSR